VVDLERTARRAGRVTTLEEGRLRPSASACPPLGPQPTIHLNNQDQQGTTAS
jgi:hypothetical protein